MAQSSITNIALSGLLVMSLLPLTSAVDKPLQHNIKQPTLYRMSHYQAPVPKTVTGAKVITNAQQLQQFLSDHPKTVLLDVYPAPRKPNSYASSDIWIEPKRTTITHAIWLANVGLGGLTHSLEHHFRQQLDQLSNHNKQQIFVIFCEPKCWHSWNAAKRAASYGFSNIYWYQQGVTGWRNAKYQLVITKPSRP